MKIEDIATIVVRPGDRLLVAVADQPTNEELYELRQAFRRELPEVDVVIISNVTGLAVYPGGDS